MFDPLSITIRKNSVCRLNGSTGAFAVRKTPTWRSRLRQALAWLRVPRLLKQSRIRELIWY